MKKTWSLIKASMTSDMKIFKLKTNKNNKLTNLLLPVILALYIMFMMYNGSYQFMSKLAPLNIAFLVLTLFAFGVSLMTILEGVYKIGPLLFNCKDDDLLLSLPIKRQTILLVRLFKFYVFELLFNSMFILPVMIAYIKWNPNLTWTYFLTSIVMLLLLPVVPIIISCIIGYITSGVSSRFKYKNAVQIIISMIILLGILFVSYNIDGIMKFVMKHATNVNDLITKIYYPAGIYTKLVTDFNLIDLITFILVNVGLLIITIFVLSKFYFKINSRLKSVSTTKKVKNKNIEFKTKSVTSSLVKKELNTFFKTPVFIINAGFALVLFMVACISVVAKYDSVLKLITSKDMGFNVPVKLITDNLSVIVLILILVTAFLTSITNSLISLEGKNINILKSLPVKVKTILMSKIYACLIITTPVLLIGDVVLFIKFKLSIIESLLLVVLSIIVPLVSHFIGLLVNLKYPKLDAENSTEVVKQSASSLVSVTIGMALMIISFIIITNFIGSVSPLLILGLCIIAFLLIDILLYIFLTTWGVKKFNKLSI